MRRAHRAAAAAALAVLWWPVDASACTTFCLARGSEAVFGRNYDFEIGDGMVLVNQRGLSKTSLRKGRPATWVSAFGSVTFNQFGRDYPMGGMNEKGLVVELMWLDEARYPPADDRPEVRVLEWIQYQLDLRDSVAAVIEHLNDVRVAGVTPLHYLVADASGAAATIEFLEGRPVVHTGAALTVPVLANDTYSSSLSWMRSRGQEADQTKGAQNSGSLSRFARAADMLEPRRQGSAPLVPSAFEILAEVAQGPVTQWSIVYDMPRREMHFRTAAHASVRTLALSRFDLACGGPVMMLQDVNAPLSGDVSARFVPWTHEANLKLITGAYGKVSFLKNSPRQEVESVAAQPLSSACAQPRPASSP